MTVSNSESTDGVVEQQPQSCSEDATHQAPTEETGTKEVPITSSSCVTVVPAASKLVPYHGDHSSMAFVFWEATVTGRRLIDEMINLGGYFMDKDGNEHEFNEYVMPYGKLPVNVTRNYNLRIVDTGRYRMLKEVRSNKMLKSKSEVAACNDFASWLVQLHKEHFPTKKLVLVYFEPRNSKILQLFQNLERFRLLDDVKGILAGCVNGWDLLRPEITELKDEHRQVLKALVEAHLPADTPMDSASHRAKAVGRMLSKLQSSPTCVKAEEHMQECSDLLEQVKKIKEELMKEAQWRPVFADMFRQGVKPRRRAGFLRHLLVESGLNLTDVTEAFKKEQSLVEHLIKEKLMTSMSSCAADDKNGPATTDADVEELVKLMNAHLTMPEKPVRRGSGRRGPRTKSMCDAKAKEVNNNSSSSTAKEAKTANLAEV